MTVSRQTRLCNSAAIAVTLKAWAPGSDPRALQTMSWRESRWSHKAEGDKAAAARAFVKNRHKWVANPWVDQPALWAASRGLFQLMVPYHLQRWSRTAHPYALFHPVISTVAAARLWNRAQQMGAKNMADVRIVWAYGRLRFKPGDPEYDKRVATTRARLGKLGFPESLLYKPIADFGLAPFGRGPQPDQDAKLAQIAGAIGLPRTAPPAERVPENWPCDTSGDLPHDDADDGSDTDDELPDAGGIPRWLQLTSLIGGLVGVGVAISQINKKR